MQIVQTEAERHMREASHTMDRKKGLGHVSIYVCMLFEDFSRLRALTEPKVAPCGSFVDNTGQQQICCLRFFS